MGAYLISKQKFELTKKSMKLLLSIISLKEARLVSALQPDILDIKNPKEGSLGAQYPWVIKEIVNEVKNTKIICSATLGDLPFKPGTASLAALGAVTCGSKYIKAGLYGVKNYEEAFQMMNSIRQSVHQIDCNALVVASGYADYNRFGSISCMEVVRAAKDAKCNVVMVDTAIKDGKSLFDAMSHTELSEFIDSAHNSGLTVALAGSINIEHIETLYNLNTDIIGIRGAVCSANNRSNDISLAKVKDFLTQLEHVNKTVSI